MKILIKRGTDTQVTAATLDTGELALATDSNILYAGNGISKLAYLTEPPAAHLGSYYYFDENDLVVPAGSTILFNQIIENSGLTYTASDGFVTFAKTGIYLISFQASTPTLSLSLCLVNKDLTEISGTTCMNSVNDGLSGGYRSVSLSTILSFNAGGGVGVKNIGTESVTIHPNYANFCVTQINPDY